jgi:hypothetical protein
MPIVALVLSILVKDFSVSKGSAALYYGSWFYNSRYLQGRVISHFISTRLG